MSKRIDKLVLESVANRDAMNLRCTGLDVYEDILPALGWWDRIFICRADVYLALDLMESAGSVQTSRRAFCDENGTWMSGYHFRLGGVS